MNERMKFTKEDSTCGNCIFFDEFEKQNKEDNVIGCCRANPPFPSTNYSDLIEGSKLGQWPLVLGNFWCGIFQRKEETN